MKSTRVPELTRAPGPAQHAGPASTWAPLDEGGAPQIVRCACKRCGAHTNAVAAYRTAASCPNCGGSNLIEINGADVIVASPLRA